MPTSHHGAARPDVKNSVVFLLARRQKNSAGRNEMMIDSVMTTRSGVLRCMGRLRYDWRATFAPMSRLLILLTGLVPALAAQQTPTTPPPPVMPMPRSIAAGQGGLRNDSGVRGAVAGYSDARLTRAVQHTMERLARRTGITLADSSTRDTVTARLVIQGRGGGGGVRE